MRVQSRDRCVDGGLGPRGTGGVALTSVCPGHVRTPMTARNRFPMPGPMEAERAAAIILRGVAQGRVRVAFPTRMALAARAAGVLPVGVRNWAIGQVGAKDPEPGLEDGQ